MLFHSAFFVVLFSEGSFYAQCFSGVVFRKADLGQASLLFCDTSVDFMHFSRGDTLANGH